MPLKDNEARLAYERRRYEKNKDKVLGRMTQRRQERRQWFDELIKDVCCAVCGETNKVCLDFHHFDPSEKDASVSEMRNQLRRTDDILKELRKCVPLCSNCHRKFHAGVLERELTERDLCQLRLH